MTNCTEDDRVRFQASKGLTAGGMGLRLNRKTVSIGTDDEVRRNGFPGLPHLSSVRGG